MDIGKRIRELREERGLAQREVARRAGLTPSGVGFIEHGQTRKPSVETVMAIARALGVPVEELLEEPVGAGKVEAPTPGPVAAGEVEPPSHGIGLRWAPDEEYEAVVKATKAMYRRRRQEIVGFEDLPSNKERRDVFEDVISAHNVLTAMGVSWERTEGLLLRELMVNAALHMLKYYETAPAQEAAVVDLEEARRLRTAS